MFATLPMCKLLDGMVTIFFTVELLVLMLFVVVVVKILLGPIVPFAFKVFSVTILGRPVPEANEVIKLVAPFVVMKLLPLLAIITF